MTDNTTPAPTPPREPGMTAEIIREIESLVLLAEKPGLCQSGWLNDLEDELVKHAPALLALAREALAAREAFEPVRDWYDGDGERTNVIEMLREAIADLQADRKDVLRLGNELRSMTEMRDAMSSACDEKLDEIDRLRAALAQLPKTADGVHVIAGTRIV